MNPFLLLLLPFVAQKRVFLFFQGVDLIDFTLCSKKCKRIIESMIFPFTGITLELKDFHGTYSETISLMYGDQKCSDFTIQDIPSEEGIGKRNIEGMELTVKKTEAQGGVLAVQRQDLQRAIIPLYHYIQGIFKNLPIHRFASLNVNDFDPSAFGIQETQELHMCKEAHARMSSPDFQYLLNMNVPKKAILAFHVDGDINPLPISCDTFQNLIGRWLQRDMFLQLNCVHINLWEPNITKGDVKDFIENWWNSDNVRLKKLVIERFRGANVQLELDPKITTKPWDPVQRARYYNIPGHKDRFHDRIDCSQGKDILREKDQLLATIVEREDSMNFVVWHQRFHAYQEPPALRWNYYD